MNANDEICDCGTQSQDTMATNLDFLMSEPAIVTPNWEMIEFIEKEKERMKDLRDAHKLITLR